MQLLQESEGQQPLHTPFAALLAATRTSHISKEERAQKGKSSFGLQFEKSTEFIQKVWKRIKQSDIIIIVCCQSIQVSDGSMGYLYFELNPKWGTRFPSQHSGLS